MSRVDRFSFVVIFLSIIPIACHCLDPFGREVKAEQWKVDGALAAFHDSDPRVKAKGLEMLYRIDSLDEIYNELHEIESLMSNPMVEVRKSTVKSLRGLDVEDEQIWHKAASLLKDVDRSVRTQAFYTLKAVDEKVQPQIKYIESLLNNECPGVRGVAMELLCRLDKSSDEFGQISMEMLRSDDGYIRDLGASILNCMGERVNKYGLELKRLFLESDPEFRKLYLKAMANMTIDFSDCLPEVLTILGNSGYGSHYHAQSVIRHMAERSNTFKKSLMDLAQHENAHIRHGISDVIKNLGEQSKEFIPDIQKLFESNDPDSRYLARHLTVKLGENAKELAPQLCKMIDEPDEKFKIKAIYGLESMGELEERCVKRISQELESENIHVRRAASRALEILGVIEKSVNENVPDPVALDNAVSKLKSPNRNERIRGIWQLLNAGNYAKPYQQYLISLLHDPEPTLRRLVRNRLPDTFQMDLESVVTLLIPTYYDESIRPEFRALAHFCGGGDPDVERMLSWLAFPEKMPEMINHAEAISTLARIFHK